ncbi:MAG TPA: hypothetical protein ENN31_00795 [Candidatus Vogelbacteria bacterium]|nr:hypothetical protein [Candidatus Vogelbacteria bacterium]
MGLISVVALTNFSPTIAQGPAIIDDINSEIVEENLITEGNKDDKNLSNSSETFSVDENDKEFCSISQRVIDKSNEWGVDPKLAKAIAFCESSNRHYVDSQNKIVLRGVKNSSDVGLFQINEKYHLKTSKDLGYNIYDLDGNIDYAMWLMSNEGTRHWRHSQKCWQDIK